MQHLWGVRKAGKWHDSNAPKEKHQRSEQRRRNNASDDDDNNNNKRHKKSMKAASTDDATSDAAPAGREKSGQMAQFKCAKRKAETQRAATTKIFDATSKSKQAPRGRRAPASCW